MRITCIETLQCRTYPNLVWVQVHTDAGLVGLGETFFGPEAVAAYVHETAAPYLLGQDPTAIQRHHSVLGRRMMLAAMGAEARGRSALDIALWDLFGQSVGLPIYRCLGGPVREWIRAYNTCAGYGYNTHRAARAGGSYSQSWGVGEHQGLYEDLAAWQDEDRAADLARSLLDMGITAMKIWPFDQFADETNGQHISLEQIERGLRPFRQIREAVGSRMDIAVELHSRWNLASALRIAEALEEIRPMWIEDPVRMDSPDVLAEFAAKTPIPTTASETLSGRQAFRAMLERQAMGIVMLDPGWVGGISEAHHVATMAAAYHRPVAPHDCTGPVAYVAGTHLCLAEPNAMIQEVVRAYAFGWYGDLLTELPILENGSVTPPQGPGLGARLVSGFAGRSDVTVRVSRA